VSEAFKVQGIKVIYVFRPWKRCLGEAKAGTIDGTPGWLKNKERLKHFLFSKKIAQNKNAFIYLKSTDFDWKTIDDLANYTIGIVSGYFYGNDIKEANMKGQLSLMTSPTDGINFRQLFNNRVSAILCEYEVAKSLLADKYKNKNKLVAFHPKLSLSEDLYLLLSKKKPESRHLIKRFNIGLRELDKKGAIQRYYEESRRGDYKAK
jgi:polar amino acid transport system substrate-binding protein